MKHLKMLALAIALVCVCGVSAPAARDQYEPSAHIRQFNGTITRNGDQFVLNDAKTHTLYQLDDQTAASKFEDKRVTVTGTLDIIKNIIRIQSIAEATA
jgi:hypothetical protein